MISVHMLLQARTCPVPILRLLVHSTVAHATPESFQRRSAGKSQSVRWLTSRPASPACSPSSTRFWCPVSLHHTIADEALRWPPVPYLCLSHPQQISVRPCLRN